MKTDKFTDAILERGNYWLEGGDLWVKPDHEFAHEKISEFIHEYIYDKNSQKLGHRFIYNIIQQYASKTIDKECLEEQFEEISDEFNGELKNIDKICKTYEKYPIAISRIARYYLQYRGRRFIEQDS